MIVIKTIVIIWMIKIIVLSTGFRTKNFILSQILINDLFGIQNTTFGQMSGHCGQSRERKHFIRIKTFGFSERSKSSKCSQALSLGRPQSLLPESDKKKLIDFNDFSLLFNSISVSNLDKYWSNMCLGHRSYFCTKCLTIRLGFDNSNCCSQNTHFDRRNLPLIDCSNRSQTLSLFLLPGFRLKLFVDFVLLLNFVELKLFWFPKCSSSL